MTRARSLSQLANSNVFSVDANNSRVGIGSTIPDVKLDVGGDLYADNLTINNLIGVAATFSGKVTYEDVTNVDSIGIITARSYVSIADSIVHTGDINTAIRFPEADTFTVETAGSERLRITSAGLVGIGSETPVRQLEVFGDRSAYLRLGSNRSGAGQDEFIGGIEFFSKDVSGPGAGVRGSIEQRTSESDGSGSNMVFRTGDGSTNNVERLRITSTGRVGIGTDSPARGPLHVHATSGESHLHLTNADTGGTSEDGFSLVSLTNVDNREAWLIQRENAAMRFYINSSQRMALDTSGRLLIGRTTTSADVRLVVQGRATDSNAQGDLLLTRNGNPSGAGSGLGQIQFSDDANIGAAILGESDAAWTAGSNHPSRLSLRTTAGGASSPTERLRLDSSGRVMIATANMQSEGINANLQVRHDSSGWNIEALRSATSAAPPRLWFGKSRGSATSQTVVSVDDQLGEIRARGYDGSSYINAATVAFEVDAAVTTGNMPGRVSFYTSLDSDSLSERLRIDSRGSFHFKNGLMIENGLVSATARNGIQNVALDLNGMVIYVTAASTGTWKPNFQMSTGNDINATMGTGDVISPTMIVAKGSTAHYADTIQVDGSDVTPEWLGGAPTEGGGSGTFDVYSYTIIKTGNDTFKCFGSVSTYE